MVTSAQRPQAPEPIAVEIPYAHGLSEGVSWPWPSADLALLILHDLDADLDTVRWLCERAASAGTHVVAIDLPGHGLSSGEPSTDGPEALAATYKWLCDSVAGAVGLIAHRRSAQLLLSTDTGRPPVATVLLDPERQEGTHEQTATCWRHVPKLVILSKGSSDEYAKEIIADTTAWCLRADLVGLGEHSSDRVGFEIHVVSLALKFLLEQAAFELASRRTSAPAEPAGAADGEA